MRRPIATGQRVELHRPRPADRDEFLAAVVRSQALHGLWVQAPSTPALYAAYVRRVRDTGARPMIVRARDDGALVGVVNLNNILGGALQQASVGYYAFEPYARHGFMTEALRLVVSYCFGELGLHRVEANIQPGNAASRALAQRVGFAYEGFSPRYLWMAGEWRDHERYAIVAP